MDLNKPVWKMNKREAGTVLVILAVLGIGALLIDATHLMLCSLTVFFSAAIFGWRVWYLVSRDQKNAALSYTAVQEPEPDFRPKEQRQDGIFLPPSGPRKQ